MSLSPSDSKRLGDAIDDVIHHQQKDIKCTLSLHLDIGEAKIYHMGKNNPNIRIDIKTGGKK